MKVFDWIIEFLDKFELSGVTLITKGLAVIMPLPVAYQTKQHAVIHLGYSDAWSWIVAVIVECFGYAAIYKALQFAEHNRRYADPKNKAPFQIAITVYAFYLGMVITFNVIPEIATGKPSYIIAMNVALALLNIPGGVLMGISAIHTERKANILKRRTGGGSNENEQPANEAGEQPANERTPRRTPRTNSQIPQPANERRTKEQPNDESERPLGFPQNERRETILAFVEQVRAKENRTPGPSEIARELGVSKGYASDVMNGKA